MRNYIIKWVLPGLSFMILAFVAGSQKSFWLGLFGFLPFFTIGIVLIAEGYRKMKKQSQNGEAP